MTVGTNLNEKNDKDLLDYLEYRISKGNSKSNIVRNALYEKMLHDDEYKNNFKKININYENDKNTKISYCINCGTKIVSKFCSECGTKKYIESR